MPKYANRAAKAAKGVPTPKKVVTFCANSTTTACLGMMSRYYIEAPKGSKPFFTTAKGAYSTGIPPTINTPGTLRWAPPTTTPGKPAKLEGLGEAETMKPGIGPLAGLALFAALIAGGYWLAKHA